MLSRLFIASRPLSWINTAYPFGAAYVLAGGGLSLDFWLGVVFFLVPYNLAMYGINDVFDYESDRRNPRKGGVEGGILTPAHHRATLVSATAAVVPFAVYFLVTSPPAAALTLLVSLAAVIAYSAPGLRCKEIPLLDSVTSSLHFSTPAWFGVMLLGLPGAPFAGLSRDGLLGLTAFFLWGMASHAFGAVQDIGPDRQAGIHSIGTAFGARGTVALSTALYACASACAAATALPYGLTALIGLPYILNTARFLTVDDPARTRAGWRVFLWLNYAAGFVLTMILLAGIVKP